MSWKETESEMKQGLTVITNTRSGRDVDGSVTPAFSQHLYKLCQQSAVGKGYGNDWNKEMKKLLISMPMKKTVTMFFLATVVLKVKKLGKKI